MYNTVCYLVCLSPLLYHLYMQGCTAEGLLVWARDTILLQVIVRCAPGMLGGRKLEAWKFEPLMLTGMQQNMCQASIKAVHSVSLQGQLTVGLGPFRSWCVLHYIDLSLFVFLVTPIYIHEQGRILKTQNILQCCVTPSLWTRRKLQKLAGGLMQPHP